MKKIIYSLFTVLLVAAFSTQMTAQTAQTATAKHTVTVTMPEIALLDIVGTSGKNVALGFTSPTASADGTPEAGLAIAQNSTPHNKVSLVYTSLVATGKTRRISVKSDAALPTGLVLTLAPQAVGAEGFGAKGTAVGTAIVITDSDQDVVTGIGSCYTGRTVGSSGSELIYSVEWDGTGVVGNPIINITYTLTAGV